MISSLHSTPSLIRDNSQGIRIGSEIILREINCDEGVATECHPYNIYNLSLFNR
jgi:hypothetical protein